MKSPKYSLVLLCFFLASQLAFPQSIKADDFKNLLVHHTITLKQLTAAKFKTVYSGPKKEGGLLTCLHNEKDDEFLFIDQKDDGTLQTITYYIPVYSDYDKLYQALKADGIKVSKLGRTLYEDNGKKYYQLVIQLNN